MAKWADYLISGVWISEKNGKRIITHVVLHEDSETDFHKGVRRSKESVIELLKSGATVVTMKWDYATGSWIGGSEVFYDEDTDEEYLKSHSDAAAADNIENLLRMISFDISALK